MGIKLKCDRHLAPWEPEIHIKKVTLGNWQEIAVLRCGNIDYQRFNINDFHGFCLLNLFVIDGLQINLS